MSQAPDARVRRWAFNLFPAYRGMGGHITYLARDWREIHVALPLTWRTRNYVGTLFGGSLYGVVDPIYMVMLIRILGPEYVVWDKAAAIRFRRPGRTTLYACFRLDEQETEAIKAELVERPSTERTYQIDLIDADGIVHASVTKTIYVGRKEAERKAQRET